MNVFRRLARRSLPQVEGRLPLRSLEAPVEVLRDRYGIPHIYAGSRRDLVRAQGYVHAQDRLFQMETTRRFAFGRLSEVAGARTLEIDRLARRLRLRWSAEQDAAACDPEASAIAKAYCEGVNEAIAHGPLPLEFRLARFRPEPWTSVDVQAPGQMFALALSGNWELELARATPGGFRDPLRERTGAGASNAFAVSGERTESGKPLLANDPHLLLAVPGIWHTQHLVWDEGEAWGFTVAGAPVIILGRNRSLAWGMTTAMVDTQDLFREDDLAGGQVVREEIRVRGRREPVVEEVVVTRHGPIVAEPNLALRWSAHEQGQTTRALLDLMTAQSVPEADEVLNDFAAPPHNFVLADAEGDIGYRLAGGPIPRRPQGDGGEPVPGDGSHDWDGWIPEAELPRELNPDSGYVISANDRVSEEIPGEYLSDYRAKRIEALLEDAGAATPETCRRIMLDRQSLPGLELAAALAGLESAGDLESRALELLAAWDGDYAAESRGGAVYGALLRALEEEVYGPEAPAAVYELGRPALIQALGARDESFLAEGRSWDEVLPIALAAAVRTLGPDPSLWRRGRLHRLRFAHALEGLPGLRRVVSRGPFPVGGDADTVLVMAPAGVADGSMIGPSMRAVYDLADPDATLISLAPGQSGHPASPHYDDLIPGWLRGELFPLATDRGHVEELTEARLVLSSE
jgi:penicillin amidase